ncbi:hypothetical protein HZS_3087 [Henneguya salminicola]|nr:hypothetical protein HZS_3087 [Henneguya salminicola]
MSQRTFIKIMPKSIKKRTMSKIENDHLSVNPPNFREIKEPGQECDFFIEILMFGEESSIEFCLI